MNQIYFVGRIECNLGSFDIMMYDLVNYNLEFVQLRDVTRRVSFSTEQNLRCATRMIAYDIIADFCDDYLDIAKFTASVTVLDFFCLVESRF